VPDPLLEGGAADVERQVEADAGRFDESHDPGHQLLEGGVSADQGGAGKPVLEVAHQGVRIVAHEDGADAAPAAGDEDGAQRALADREPDLRVRAAGAELGRCHAQQPLGLVVEPAVGAVARLVDRGGDRRRLAQLAADPLATMGRGIGSRREAGDCLEHAVEVERAEAGTRRQLLERRGTRGGLDQPAGLGHRGRVLLHQ
jgi:hypothetical protein